LININQIFKTLQKQNYSAFFFTPPIYRNAKSYIFTKPNKILTLNKSDFEKKINIVDKILDDGSIGYSVINYEAGYLFEKKLHKFLRGNEALAEFAFFDKNNFIEIESGKINFDFTNNFKITNFRLNTNKNDYIKSINKVKSYIESGDTYQVNYTIKGKFTFSGDLSSLFQSLVFNQSAQYIAVINLLDRFIISISPELFFELNGRRITAKPMKGTTQRGINLQSDSLSKYKLQNSEKEKAENVMIVDLLRNDLGRISKFGSVKVPALFEVEKYESVYQMTSEITSLLKNGIKFSDIIKNIFPCGSVTGAPKIRTMEIINSIEKENRNVYTGSIGLLLKKKILFNVAIRTLVINKATGKGEIGLGSGVVWDSEPEKEYNEVILKSKFFTSSQNYFEIFESALIRNCEVVFLKEHLERLKSTANYFLFKYNEKSILRKIYSTLKKLDKSKTYKLKFSLNKLGELKLEVTELKPLPDKIKVILSKNRISSQNKFQFFKTTNRKLYNDEHKKFSQKGFFDVIYLNEKNEVVEGAITNLFMRKNDLVLTPPIISGALTGIYRSYLLKQNSDIKENNISVEELIQSDEIFLTNSVRGKIKVDEFYLNEREYISF
jgi:para-aminobenzoate synthetase/4-amino-4-deoxychorismate lyase